MKKIFTLLSFFFAFISCIQAQSADVRKIDSLFRVNGEIYFRFDIFDPSEVRNLTRMISIDNVSGRTVYAYANRKEYHEFSKTGYQVTLLTPPGSMWKDSELMRPAGTRNPSSPGTWNFYPTYTQYVDTMVYWANAFPDLCHLDTIGTTVQGRLLLVLKISHNVNVDTAKPQFFYTSSIHGDETTGYVGMLHLIDYLVSSYGTVSRVTKLLDSTEIYINPLANPDGTYHGGNNTVNGAIRYNANNVDLNRNYPDPLYGPHPDGNSWQPETVAFMNYSGTKNFTISANFHGGAEVFNYPWDDKSQLAADNSWWIFVGREFADTIHHYAPSGYFTYLQNGITNGYAWYMITGGRQDYMNYTRNCREVTIEISNIKLLPAGQLVAYYNYLFHSFMNFIEQVNYGIQGVITDTVTGAPLKAKVNIASHDLDNSFVFSRLPSGFYDRVIDSGSWDITYSAFGYYSKTIYHVHNTRYSGTRQDVQLRPLTYGTQDLSTAGLACYPNPADRNIHVVFPETVSGYWNFRIYDILGTAHMSETVTNDGKSVFEVDVSAIPQGIYMLELSNSKGRFVKKILVRH